MPEYALTLHFGAPDEEHARKRAADIADVCAAEHGTRDPVVVPVIACELERLRGELAGMRNLFEAANEVAGARTDERDAARRRAEQAEDRLRAATDAYARLQAQADDAEAARDRWRKRGEQAEAERDEWRDLAKRSLAERERETERADDAGARALKAEEAAAEWQAACEAHATDGEALMATIERVQGVYRKFFTDSQTGRDNYREFIGKLQAELFEALYGKPRSSSVWLNEISPEQHRAESPHHPCDNEQVHEGHVWRGTRREFGGACDVTRTYWCEGVPEIPKEGSDDE